MLNSRSAAVGLSSSSRVELKFSDIGKDRPDRVADLFEPVRGSATLAVKPSVNN